MVFRLSMLSHCATQNSNALYAINLYLSSVESKQNYLKVTFFMKTVRAIQKNRACLQNELITEACHIRLNSFIEKYTVRQRKYSDKLAENFKPVFDSNHHCWFILFQLLQNFVVRMGYIFYDIVSRFFRTCWADLHNPSYTVR